MSTVGWLLILGAGILVSAVFRGRVENLGEDVSDAFLAFVQGDSDALGEVLARKGGSNEADQAELNVYKNIVSVGVGIGNTGDAVAGGIGQGLDELEKRLGKSLALAAVTLGDKAKGYRWTATGPDYYDCSGLMWRACQAVGAYRGTRFTTASFAAMTHGKFTKVDTPSVNDVVLWPGHHMGVCTGNDQFYSARSRKTGIGYSKISTFRKGSAPVYYRVGTAQSNFGTGPVKK